MPKRLIETTLHLRYSPVFSFFFFLQLFFFTEKKIQLKVVSFSGYGTFDDCVLKIFHMPGKYMKYHLQFKNDFRSKK